MAFWPLVMVLKRLPPWISGGDFLAVPFLELRLVVEEIDVRRRAVLEQVDDALRLRRKVRQARNPPSRARRRVSLVSDALPLPVTQR